MIVIRLARGGKKSKPFYRVVVADRRYPRDGRFIERLGYYNPVANRQGDQIIEIDLERMAHWVKQGAQLSQRVAAIAKRHQADMGKTETAAKADKAPKSEKSITDKKKTEKSKSDKAAA